MDRLGFHSIEHGSLRIKASKNLFYIRPVTLGKESHIFCFILTFHFYGSGYIQFLLLCPIEPAHKEPCPLSLMTIGRTTDIKQYIGILTKELFYDTNQRLCDLFVAGRNLSVHVSQIKPISSEIGISVIVKINGIGKPMFCCKNKEIIVILNIVRRMLVYSVCDKSIHGLHPFQIIIARLCGSLLAPQSFSKFGIHFLFPCLFTLTGSIEPRENLLFSAHRTIQSLCFHNHLKSIDSRCKIKKLF